MMCDIYLEEINTIIDNFTRRFGCTAFLDKEFYYYPLVDKIGYCFDFGKACKPNKMFMESVKRHKPKVKLNIFTWCLLHELGHHATNDDFDEEEMARIDKKRRRVNKTQAHHPYYNLPDELSATTWAVEYANAHREEMLDFEDEIYEAVKKLKDFLDNEGE